MSNETEAVFARRMLEEAELAVMLAVEEDPTGKSLEDMEPEVVEAGLVMNEVYVTQALGQQNAQEADE